MKKILVLDDSLSVRESLKMILKDKFSISDSGIGKKPFPLTEIEGVDLVVLGINQPLDPKIEFTQRLIEHNNNVALLLMVEDETSREILDLFDHGVSDLVFKPFSVHEIREKVQGLLSRKIAISSLPMVSHKTKRISNYLRIYRSPLVGQQVAAIIARALNNDAPVLVQGENGSGQELIAKIIHHNSLRKEKGFFKLSCLNLTEELFVSRLLEIAKGASPGSLGTLFMEGIDVADSNVQIRLMDILEEQVITTKGRQDVSLDLRVIASTRMDLLEKIDNGEFREDLFYRLKTIPIYISPLRERKASIPKIADYILDNLCQRMSFQRKKISLDAANILKNYYWPGNLLELESVVTRSAILTDKEIISGEELSFGLGDAVTPIPIEEEEPKERYVKTPVKRDEHTMAFSFNAFITSLAHEVKNPLVSIKTFTQLLSERFEDSEFRGRFYEIVGENVDRLNTIVEGAISYTQFPKPTFRNINLRTAIEKALEKNLGNLVEHKSIVLKDFEKDLPPVLSDETQLQYVLDNVFSSAIAMMDEGKDLSLSVRASDLNLKNVIDSAESEKIDNRAVEITIPLYDSRMTTLSIPNTPPILGLGLYLAQRLVNKDLGIMEVKTTAGGGLIIIIKLPVTLGDGC